MSFLQRQRTTFFLIPTRFAFEKLHLHGKVWNWVKRCLQCVPLGDLLISMNDKSHLLDTLVQHVCMAFNSSKRVWRCRKVQLWQIDNVINALCIVTMRKWYVADINLPNPKAFDNILQEREQNMINVRPFSPQHSDNNFLWRFPTT